RAHGRQRQPTSSTARHLVPAEAHYTGRVSGTRAAAVVLALVVCGRASAQVPDAEAIAMRSHSADATEHYAVGISLLGTGVAAIVIGTALPEPPPSELDRGREIGPVVAGIGAAVLALGIGLDIGAALWSTARRARTGGADLNLEMRELRSTRTGLAVA